jgi:cytochrome c peroxidase
MKHELFRMGLVACLLAGCVKPDGKLSRPEASRVHRKFKGDAEDLTARGNEYANDAAAAELGRYLFFYKGFTVEDTRGDDPVPTSCASCHQPDHNFSDARQTSVGASEKVLARRSPALYQAFNRHFLFWDGRIDSLWAQALLPIEDIDEMGSNRLRVVRKVASEPVLREKYEHVFGALPDLSSVPFDDAWPCGKTPPRNVPTQAEQEQQFDAVQREQLGDPSQSPPDPIPDTEACPTEQEEWCENWKQIPEAKRTEITKAFVNVGKAIAAYETKIRSENSRFDEMYRDVRQARGRSYRAAEIRGLELFMGKGRCVRCHDGADFTDDEFHYLGIIDTHHDEAKPGDHLHTSRSNWLEGAFILLEHEFNCFEAKKFGQPCGKKALRRLNSSRSVEQIITIRAGQRVVAGQVRTPSLRNVADNEFWMHNGDQTKELGFAVGFYNTRPRGPQPVTVLRPDLAAHARTNKGKVRKKERRIRAFGSTDKGPLQKKVDRKARRIKLQRSEIADIVAFLETLSGAPIPEHWRDDPWRTERRGRRPGPRSEPEPEPEAEPEPETEPEPEPLSTEPAE